jgi:diaminohydroxyphosphoribosylaminopyrimidine deaminase / 5-amino-6-(5-phosphoribosylamino)uracil reductase
VSKRFSPADEKGMRAAIAAAERSLPSPNPPVGAIVVDVNGKTVGVGHHKVAGGPHAEAVALEAAGEAAQGGTLYVTLEPCNHQGRTPPCTLAIQKSGISRVVVGCRDPNPHVDGGGADRLRSQGVIVEVGLLESDCTSLIEPWSTFILTGLPFVSLKLALSLDGRIATRTGASRWVTGPEARGKVQELRALNDAIGVGINTVIADDPRLTVRDPDWAGRRPRRVVFDSSLRIPLDSRLVTEVEQAPVLIVTTPEANSELEAALVDSGCEVIRAEATAEGRVDFESALRELAGRGIVGMLVEGGAELAGTALAARLVHRLHAFVAPILLGPRGRPGAVDWAGPDTPQTAPRILDPKWELLGSDAHVSGPLVFPEE